MARQCAVGDTRPSRRSGFFFGIMYAFCHTMNTTSSKTESPLHIVFASDQNFLRRLTVASGSAVYAARGVVSLHVLDCGIDESSWTSYAAFIDSIAAKANVKVSLVRHRIDMSLFAKFRKWNGSRAAWARLLIPDLLPNVDRCIYSDCDMLFVADPHEMLEAFADSNALLAGHRDPQMKGLDFDESWCQRHGVEFDSATYLCSGLLVMNLAAFRAENIVEKCFAFAAENPDVPLPDQTTLNRVCFGRKTLLPSGWGLFTYECHGFDGYIKSIHYAGCRCWPWETCRNYQDAIWRTIAKEAYDIWLDFEKRILALSLPGPTKPALRLRLIAAGVLFLERVATRLGIQVGHGRLQGFLALHDRKTPALANIRREVCKVYTHQREVSAKFAASPP